MMSTALPIWVADHTDAPRALSGVLVVISSVAIAALQVRATRTASTPQRAARVAVLSAAALAASCVLFALASGPAATTAAVVLLAGGLAHVAGELLFVAASWGLSVPLMPDGRAGEYQGVFATGEAAALAVAPLLMTAVVVGWGQAGWLALGALFVVATLPAPAITRRALRARGRARAVAPARGRRRRGQAELPGAGAGTCCVMQWTPPPPSASVSPGTATASRPG